jgi:hypothetical protein
MSTLLTLAGTPGEGRGNDEDDNGQRPSSLAGEGGYGSRDDIDVAVARTAAAMGEIVACNGATSSCIPCAGTGS